MKYILLSFTLIIIASTALAQSYNAIKGSSYAGVEAMYNNPASTVNSVFKWDVQLMSTQLSFSNSAFRIDNASLNSLSNTNDFNGANPQITNGSGSRNINSNFDFNLLNFRFKINNKNAIAFGLRLRTFDDLHADPFTYNDSISSLNQFLQINSGKTFNAYATHSGWMEFDLNYSRVLVDNYHERFSAGITMGYMIGLSGFHAALDNIAFSENINPINNESYYTLTGGGAKLRYSANYDNLDSNATVRENINNFLSGTHAALNLNVGIEYIIKNEDSYTYTSSGHEWDLSNYSWKFGASIMDLGTNRFNYSINSFDKQVPTQKLTDTAIASYDINSLGNLRDTLSNSFVVSHPLPSTFTIANPTRLVVYADKNLGHNFYANFEATLNFFSTRSQERVRTKELNMLVLTPRWETRVWGLYLPVQFNTQTQLWVGAAVKMGPLLIGIHRLDFFKIFSNNTQTLNGGGYVLLSIYPFSKKKEEECPHY